MKRLLFSILWMVGFFTVGFIILVTSALVVAHFTAQATEPASWRGGRELLLSTIDWLFPIGLPILALILAVLGKLPGTRKATARI